MQVRILEFTSRCVILCFLTSPCPTSDLSLSSLCLQVDPCDRIRPHLTPSDVCLRSWRVRRTTRCTAARPTTPSTSPSATRRRVTPAAAACVTARSGRRPISAPRSGGTTRPTSARTSRRPDSAASEASAGVEGVGEGVKWCRLDPVKMWTNWAVGEDCLYSRLPVLVPCHAHVNPGHRVCGGRWASPTPPPSEWWLTVEGLGVFSRHNAGVILPPYCHGRSPAGRGLFWSTFPHSFIPCLCNGLCRLKGPFQDKKKEKQTIQLKNVSRNLCRQHQCKEEENKMFLLFILFYAFLHWCWWRPSILFIRFFTN